VWYYSAGQNDSPPYIFPRNSGNCLSLALKLGPIDGRSALISPIKIEWNPRDIEKLSIQARGKRPGQKDSTLFKLGFSIDNYVQHIAFEGNLILQLAMGRKDQLTEYERGQINAYPAQGVSASQIGAAIGRSRKPISNYLCDPASY